MPAPSGRYDMQVFTTRKRDRSDCLNREKYKKIGVIRPDLIIFRPRIYPAASASVLIVSIL
ncbi:hypothetical protein J2W42_001171 [Rhizobium tibeticum]|uniref:Uncharacterized protein n=1 Tax=Rhizobium tibeticum TaxID=501024 RepID=A0A1H8CLG2_9HYPH|nr:hypothetical protein [Rhizobium tibeticum]SEH48358.1 hypothetical protein RTCCBAU85039_0657 [Rhizobium tibeticum]SEM95816.1 hypothetical protein SAMN05216228_1001209 [Rhizobium tibeticum]